MIRFGKSVGVDGVRIAVIGGGAAGAAVIGEFLRRGSAACELIWLTGRSTPGRGIAYATDNCLHLLNVRAANMGLFADDTGALLRFLAARCTPALPGDFQPDAAGRAMRADGTAEAGLRVIGTLLRGTLWECTALPEIRAMAARLVREFPNELGHARLRSRGAIRCGEGRKHIDMAIRQFGV